MQGLINFLDDLLGGFELIALALVVGGVAWGLFVHLDLRPLRQTFLHLKAMGFNHPRWGH